jgi:hypothetical protein
MKKRRLALLALSSALLLSSCNSKNNDSHSSSSEDSSFSGHDESSSEEKMSSSNTESGSSSSEEKATFTLSATHITLGIGQTYGLTASIDGVSFSSNNVKVATIDENGLITGIALGEAIITATCGEAKALAKVTVTDELVSLLSISFSTGSLALYEGDSVNLKPIVKYGEETLDEASIVYSSSDESLASYNEGKITAKKKGSVTLSAKVTYSGYSDVAYLSLEVISLALSLTPNFKARNVVVNEEGLALSFVLTKGGEEAALTSPLSYSLDDETLAEVKDGKLYGKKKGVVELTISTIYDEETVTLKMAITINERISVSFYSEGSLLKSYSILNGEKVALDIDEPKLEGYFFNGFLDENGNPFSKDSVFETSACFSASWLASTGNIDGSASKLVKKWASLDEFVCPENPNDPDKPFFHAYGDDDKDTSLVEGSCRFDLQVSGVYEYNITLPAFDYVSAGRVDFYLADNYSDGYDSFSIGGATFSFNVKRAEAYIAAKGNTASLYVNDSLFAVLSEDASNGKEGLKITFNRFDGKYQDEDGKEKESHAYTQFYLGGFVSYSYDYMAKLDEFIASLPEDPTSLSTDEKLAKLDSYILALSYLTPYQTLHFVEPSKVTALKNSLKGTSIALFALPDAFTWESIGDIGIKTDGKSFGGSKESGYLGINFQNGGVSDGDTQYVEFPKINYSLYSSVTFKIKHNMPGASVKVGESALLSEMERDTEYEVAVTFDESKATVSIGDASLELPEDVSKGESPLRFDVYRQRAREGQYDTFSFTPFKATF